MKAQVSLSPVAWKVSEVSWIVSETGKCDTDPGGLCHN